MTASEILELVRAGYSRAEIDAMQQPEPQQPEPQQPEPQQPEWAAKLNESINNLIGAIQKINRDSLEQPDDDPNKQVDEALAAYLGKKK